MPTVVVPPNCKRTHDHAIELKTNQHACYNVTCFMN